MNKYPLNFFVIFFEDKKGWILIIYVFLCDKF